MTFRKTAALISALILTVTALTSCGYRISITKKEDDTTVPATTSPVFTQPPVTESTTAAVPTTSAEDNTGIVVDASYKTVPMSKEQVMYLYTLAMNNVKMRSPGFTKKEYQDVFDIEAGSGVLQLANRIMNLVVTELLTSSGDAKSTMTVNKGDDVRCREYFPVFGENYGCAVSDLSIISSAVCYTDGANYKLVITLNDALNPEPVTSEFGKIMTPVKRENIAGGIEEYLVVLDTDQYKFNINYTGSEIVCIMGIETSEISSLSQKMIMNMDINLNLNLVLFSTKVVEAKGTIINHLEYSAFDWQD